MGFVEEAENLTHTENEALAYRSTTSPILDLFFIIGASRGMDIIPLFAKAFDCCREDSIRIALWARDVRGGAGERKLFRDVLEYVEEKDIELFKRMAAKIPVVGRWDDMLVAKTEEGFGHVSQLIKEGIEDEWGRGDRSLGAKWMPREGEVAKRLREAWKQTPKQYRKYLVEHTKVVESDMCGRRWDEVKFEEVPSVALARYTAAFKRHSGERFGEFLDRVRSGEVKINAGAVYPYDVLKTLRMEGEEVASEQWKALADHMKGESVLPMVDVSGSMGSKVGGGSSLTCMDVAVSLGLYISTKQKGCFRDLMLTFHSSPMFISVKDKGTLKEKVDTVMNMPWGCNTDIGKAFELILRVAKSSKARKEDMPRILIVLSDMEFDAAVSSSGSLSTTYEGYKQMFRDEGYERPTVVFWNLQSRNGHVPVKFDEGGTILVSGFSPSLMRFVVGSDLLDITPLKIMEGIIRNERYDF